MDAQKQQQKASNLPDIEALGRQTVAQLKAKYRELFGQESRSNHKQFLMRRVAWRLQAIAEGDLSERARQRALTLAQDADLRLTAPPSPPPAPTGPPPRYRDPRLPSPGTVLTRNFQGKILTVDVLEEGFRYEDRVYRSLSAVARQISGSQWNGFLFFGRALRESAGSAQMSGFDRKSGRGRDLVGAHGNVNVDEATNPRGGTD